MIYGIPPFYNREQNTQMMFVAITKDDVKFGVKAKASTDAKDIILKVIYSSLENILAQLSSYCRKILRKDLEQKELMRSRLIHGSMTLTGKIFQRRR